MGQATRVGQLTFSDHVERALREGAMWALMCVALYLLIALISYSPADPGWSYAAATREVTNTGGIAGAWFADVAFFLFGYFAFLLPLSLAWGAWAVFRAPPREPGTPAPVAWPRAWVLALRWSGALLLLLSGTALAAVHFDAFGSRLPNGPGGGLGLLLRTLSLDTLSLSGTNLLLIGTLLIGGLLFSGLSLVGLMELFSTGAWRWVRQVSALGREAILPRGWLRNWRMAWPPNWRMDWIPNWRMGWNGIRRRFQGPRVRDDALPSALNLIDPEAPAAPPSRPASVVKRPRAAGSSKLPAGLLASMYEPATARAPLSRETEAEPAPSMPAAKSRPEPDSAPRAPMPARSPAARSGLDAEIAPVPPVPGARRPAVESSGPPLPAGAPGDALSTLPPLELLDVPKRTGGGYTDEQIEDLSRQVEAKLLDFGVEVQVEAVYPGPVVTLFELQLSPGTKVSKITGLAKDLARALSTISVRVVEVIPGKSVIGLEIPNLRRETVFLRETLGSEAYQAAKSPLSLGLGTDISGLPVIVDLARMPHVLIAGTTGSGKSVAINAMILSLLYKAGPRDVRLIMVDPKMLELSVYEGIPHLLTPVVTDMKEAANALRWCVGEMERRYRLMAKLGVRNIGGYNRRIAEAAAAGTPLPDPLFDRAAMPGVTPPALEHLPYIVVIIDELADMMMVVGKKVEELIARLAQKARASGIHLLLATQRPSVDVLTGLIKANIPTRMAFQVSSRIDSRTVLDQMGAEQLLGHGDMLYLPPGVSIPQRVHGAFVDDHEVHRVVEYLQQFGAPEYLHDVLNESTETLPGIDPEPRGEVEGTDPLFDEAVQIVIESRRASVSGVQRRLKIGYNRAARLVEEMERIGLVGPPETNGAREVLVPPPRGEE